MGEEWHEITSKTLGWVSVTCWVVFAVPQLWENYKNKKCEGLSFLFLLTWLAGDSLNFAGAILAGVLPSEIYVAAWYVTSDVITIAQYLYYEKFLNRSKGDDEEENPLLSQFGDSAESRRAYTLPGLLVCLLLAVVMLLPGASSLLGEGEWRDESRYTGRSLLSFDMNSESDTSWTGYRDMLLAGDNPDFYSDGNCYVDDPDLFRIGKAFGWASAVLYISSRLPQIHKNYRRKSVQGLNVYTFILAVCGNVTYAGSIFIYSAHLCFLHKNLPWIVGSTGTLGLDFFIFYQFYIYGAEEEKQGKEEEADKLRIN